MIQGIDILLFILMVVMNLSLIYNNMIEYILGLLGALGFYLFFCCYIIPKKGWPHRLNLWEKQVIELWYNPLLFSMHHIPNSLKFQKKTMEMHTIMSRKITQKLMSLLQTSSIRLYFFLSIPPFYKIFSNLTNYRITGNQDCWLEESASF